MTSPAFGPGAAARGPGAGRVPERADERADAATAGRPTAAAPDLRAVAPDPAPPEADPEAAAAAGRAAPRPRTRPTTPTASAAGAAAAGGAARGGAGRWPWRRARCRPCLTAALGRARRLLLLVALPFAAAAGYLFTRAADQYHSEVAFSIRSRRSPRRPPGCSGR